MKAFLPLAFLAFAVGLVSGQGYYGGDSGGQVQQQPAQQQISSLPQYEGSSGTNDENYWWLKDNPFQKPPNHPGVVKSDEQSSGARPSQTYSSQSQPRAQSPPSPALNAKPTPKQAPKKEFKYRPITASYGPGPTSDPEDNPCMLRVKSDCHASGSSPPTPSLNVAEQVPYSSNAYSGNSYNAQQQRPQYNQQPSYNQQSIGQQYNQVQNYEEQPPYPGCPAAMLCVPDDWCNATGYSEGRPLSLSPAAKSFRVAVMACTNVETNEVGICCRDPDYKDPWPGQNGDGGHEHHQEPKPQVQQQQYQQPQQQQQQQYMPQQQQYQPPAQAPQQPQQQNAYSASQSSRPQAPQQQPSYGSAGQSYSPQPQRQPQPSYNPTYQQPQQPQKSPFSSVSQTYQPQPQQQQQPSYGARPQPQPQQPSYGARPQSQPQQPTYGAQPQTQQQPTYGAQTYSQQPQQQSQKPQQTSYADAGAGGPSPNPYAGAGYSGVGCKSQSY